MFPAFVTRTIRNKRCYKGDTVSFLCEVIETDTLAQWYKDGTKIENKRYLIKQIGKIHELTITFADHSDNGCFTVNVNNRTRQATLVVEEYFAKTLRNTSCFEGATVKFECVVAETGMSALWYKDGVKIENKRYHIKLIGKTHELIIENAEHSDTGCFTVNVNGRSKQATLIVQDEELYEYVRYWKQIRNRTLLMSDLLTRELQEANEKIRNAKVSGNFTVWLVSVGGALYSIFTAGASMARALRAAAITGGATGITHIVETFVEKDVLRITQDGINKDKKATYHLITRLRAFRGTDSIPFADNLHQIKLKGIDDLAKDPLGKFISSFVDTERASLLKAVEKIIELRVLLEHELQEVERIQRQYSFS